MKRWLLRIFMFLLLGAIVNVAVAWGLSQRSWPYAEQFDFEHALAADEAAIAYWRHHAVADFPDQPAVMHRLHRFGYRSLAMYEKGDMRDSLFFAYAQAHGWPMVALESQHWIHRYRSDKYRAIMLGGWPLPAGSAAELPILPVWPGFVINTGFYVFVLWLLNAGAFALRRRWRIKRGLCPKCGYDLRGTKDAAACPECGAVVQT